MKLPTKILTKEQMYEHLMAGGLGNTIPQWLDLEVWQADETAQGYPFWGVRSLTPGGPCRLFCPREEVARTVEEFARQGHQANISLMVDTVANVLLMADVFDDVDGWRVYGVLHPGKGANWRKIMPSQGREWKGLSARMLLRSLLSPGSYSDLEACFERWPGHVVELSVLDRCLGTVPGRNAVIWEIRESSGIYERSNWKHCWAGG